MATLLTGPEGHEVTAYNVLSTLSPPTSRGRLFRGGVVCTHRRRLTHWESISLFTPSDTCALDTTLSCTLLLLDRRCSASDRQGCKQLLRLHQLPPEIYSSVVGGVLVLGRDSPRIRRVVACVDRTAKSGYVRRYRCGTCHLHCFMANLHGRRRDVLIDIYCRAGQLWTCVFGLAADKHMWYTT